MNLSRRGFLGGVVGLIASPAIVRASSLMPVKAVSFGPTFAELNAITRKAFIPVLVIEQYWGNPDFRTLLAQNWGKDIGQKAIEMALGKSGRDLAFN